MSDGVSEVVSGSSVVSSMALGGARANIVANTQTVVLPGSNLVFENTYGSGVSQDYVNAIVMAENYLQTALSTTATLRFTFNMGDIGSAVGENVFQSDVVNFSTLSNALSSHESTGVSAAIANEASQFAGASFAVPEDLASLLGLPQADANSMVTVTLNQNYSYFFDPARPTPLSFDAVGALMHEISEGGFGRTGGDQSGGGVQHGVLDLFRYTAPGGLDATLGQDGASAFFSSDGVTLSTRFHNELDANGVDDGYDSGDWEGVVAVSANLSDAFGATDFGKVGVVTQTDLDVLKVLGWSPATKRPRLIVNPGVTFRASAGPAAVVSSATVLSGGAIQVLAGGLAVDTMLNGGNLYVAGTTSLTHVESGTEYLQSGGSATSTTVDSKGVQVLSGGAATTGTILAGGTVLVYSGATASALYQSSGALYVAGQVESATVGGQAFVLSGGYAGGWVLPGGVEVVSSGGAADHLAVSGTALVYGGGSAANGSVEDGGDTWREAVNSGDDFVLAGGRDHGAWVASNGVQVISSGGVATGGLLSGGLQLVFGGGSASQVTLLFGGRTYVAGDVVFMSEGDGSDEFVLAGGASTGSVVYSGGVLVISSGATASRALVQSGGMQLVFGGGVASGTTIIGGSDYVSGTISGTTLSSVAKGAPNYDGASPTYASRFYPGLEFIQAGGASFSTTVSSGGVEVISSGAAASGLNIAGGQALVFADARAGGTTIKDGQVYVSGTTLSTTILGGDEFILPGGTASGATVSGGFEVVSSGGSSTSAVISSGGGLIVYAGGDIGGSLTLAGGIAYLAEAVTAGSTVTFSGAGGHLVLDDPTTFAGRIAGLNLPSQGVDLSGFAYGSGETGSWTEAADNTSGTLTVTDGAKTATLTLLGSYVTSNFTLSDDGGGGTLIVDPPVPVHAAAGANLMAQAMASLGPERVGNPGATPNGETHPPPAPTSIMFTTSALR